jgi:PEGA domain
MVSEPARTALRLLVLLALQTSATVFAQTDPRAAAREHFTKGVAAFDDRRFAEAADEFEAAYKLSPAFVVLFNIGQVDVALGRSVEAVDAFNSYLKQGGASIGAARRQEVQREIEKQTARIGTIDIHTTPDGADIRIDGKLTGKTPLEKPVRVNAGKHSVEATLAEHTPQARDLEVAGRADIRLDLALEPLAALAAAAPAPIVPLPAEHPAVADSPAPEPPIVEKTFIERTYVEAPSIQQTARPAGGESSTGGTVQRIVGYVVIAGGLTTATIGGLLAYSGANQANDASNRLANAATPEDWDKAKPDYDAGKSKNEKGWAIAGIGTAVVIGGIVVLATAPSRATIVGLGPWMTASNAGGMSLSGVW